MTFLTKALLGTGAAAAALVSTASPALARDRDGIDIGDIIAGAVILGGIAAVAGAIGKDRYDRGYSYGYPYDGYGYDRYGYNDRYYRYGNPRQAVEQCVRATERYAARRSWGGRADVTDIRDIDRTRRGYVVRGRVAVNTRDRGYRYGDPYYGRGWGRDYRGWNDNLRGYDAGRFRCRFEYGRVTDIDIDGIRGL